MKNSLLKRVIQLYNNNPRAAILMSGKGSNADIILSQRNRYPNVNFISIITDNHSSNALSLSQKYQLEFYCREKDKFFNRDDYFKQLADYLNHMKIDTLIYAGFMTITPAFFLTQFPGINVHPADLTLLDEHHKPKYRGMDAIQQAIKQHDNYIASTAHIVDADVDCGSPILVSKHLSLEGRFTHDIAQLHEQLKVTCEHLLFPRVIELLSKGLINPEHTPYHWDRLHPTMRINNGQFFSEKLFKLKDMMSPLDLSYLSQYYSSCVGFDFSHIDEVMTKVIEEFEELQSAYENREDNLAHFIDEIGDCFFSLANLCRFIDIHPETVVSRNVMKYLNRCKIIEEELKNSDRDWSHVKPDEILPLWYKAKQYEKNN